MNLVAPSSTRYAIRTAEPGDAMALARVHVAAWRSTYRGILPESYLAGLSLPRYESFWTRLLADPDPNLLRLVLAGEDGSIGGFLTAGTPHDLPAGGASSFRGQMHALYILENLQGRGYGRRLMVHAANCMAERRLTPFCLWVIADNVQARDFYELLGGLVTARRQQTIGGARVEELAYQFLDAAAMQKLALKSGRRPL